MNWRRISKIGLFILLMALVGTILVGSIYMQGGQTKLPTETITANDASITVELATTPAEQEQGLSNRFSLSENHGMLFVYTGDVAPGFWMKEMRFSLDIIWINAQGLIVTIHSNLTPQTYPTAFYPTALSRYVLEVPAGYAAKHNLMVGSKIQIPK